MDQYLHSTPNRIGTSSLNMPTSDRPLSSRYCLNAGVSSACCRGEKNNTSTNQNTLSVNNLVCRRNQHHYYIMSRKVNSCMLTCSTHWSHSMPHSGSPSSMFSRTPPPLLHRLENYNFYWSYLLWSVPGYEVMISASTFLTSLNHRTG